MALGVLTWNLFHGRSVPGAGRELLPEFTAALAGWEWDVALLQEVPPWWPPRLAGELGAAQRTVLTSRNGALALRRAVARRRPDLIKSGGGGANAILVRGGQRRGPRWIVEHRTLRLALCPERRWMNAVRLAGGEWLANLHLSAHDHDHARIEVRRAAASLRGWADAAPAVLGGDFNLRDPAPEGFTAVAGENVDHVFVDGWRPDGPATALDAGSLSDHRPLRVTLRVAR